MIVIQTPFQKDTKVLPLRSLGPTKPRRNITVLMKGTKLRTPCFRCEIPPPQEAVKMRRKFTTNNVIGKGINVRGKSKSTRFATNRCAIQNVNSNFICMGLVFFRVAQLAAD